MRGRIRITSKRREPIDVEKLVRALLQLLKDLEAAGESIRAEKETPPSDSKESAA